MVPGEIGVLAAAALEIIDGLGLCDMVLGVELVVPVVGAHPDGLDVLRGVRPELVVQDDVRIDVEAGLVAGVDRGLVFVLCPVFGADGALWSNSPRS